MDPGREGPPGEGRSRGEKVLNIESEWEKGVFKFPPRGRLQGKAVDRGVQMEVPGLAVQTCREQGRPLSESLPGLTCPAVPESGVGRLAFPCDDSRVNL